MSVIRDDAIENALQQGIERTLRYRGAPPDNWVEPAAGTDHDVLIVGGGQNALALVWTLRHLGIRRVTAIEAKPAGQAGIWRDTARMRTLRTQKTLTGPDMGFTPLSFATWYDAHQGEGAFDAVGQIDRIDWGNYLSWFEQAAHIGVRHEIRVAGLSPEGAFFRVHLESPGRTWTEVARKVVFANGIGGLGQPVLPAFLTQALPPAHYGHTADRLDFEALRGRSVGIIGSAASAFDAAAVALEQGAADVHMFCRKDIPPTLQINKSRNYIAAQDRFFTLPDALRWTLFDRAQKAGTAPPADSVRRLLGHANFRLHTGRDLSGLSLEGGRIRLPFDGPALDFIVAGTGYAQDANTCTALSGVSHRLAQWGDRYRPGQDEANAILSRYPYLGAAFEFLPKDPAEPLPWAGNLHAFTPAAGLSFGRYIGDVPSMRFAVNHLSQAVFDSFFREDLAVHERRMRVVPEDREFDPSLYAPLLSPPAP